MGKYTIVPCIYGEWNEAWYAWYVIMTIRVFHCEICRSRNDGSFYFFSLKPRWSILLKYQLSFSPIALNLWTVQPEHRYKYIFFNLYPDIHTFLDSFSRVVLLFHCFMVGVTKPIHIWGMIFWWFVMKSWWASVALDVSLVFNTLKASGGIEASNETVNCGERPGVLSWKLFLFSSFTSRNACFPTGL